MRPYGEQKKASHLHGAKCKICNVQPRGLKHRSQSSRERQRARLQIESELVKGEHSAQTFVICSQTFERV